MRANAPGRKRVRRFQWLAHVAKMYFSLANDLTSTLNGGVEIHAMRRISVASGSPRESDGQQSWRQRSLVAVGDFVGLK